MHARSLLRQHRYLILSNTANTAIHDHRDEINNINLVLLVELIEKRKRREKIFYHGRDSDDLRSFSERVSSFRQARSEPGHYLSARKVVAERKGATEIRDDRLARMQECKCMWTHISRRSEICIILRRELFSSLLTLCP